ncbi:MAG: class I SAM-dependent methyltransferase [Hyphomicrobiales bacterium]
MNNHHASQMDGIYKSQRHIYDLTRKYYLFGRDQLLDDLKPEYGESVLEVGCGTGRNLIMAARKYPWAKFYGLDISEEMLITARANVEKAGFSDRITLAKGDASHFSTSTLFYITHFDHVFYSYTLSMIPLWENAIEQGLKALSPEGVLHIVDFGQQESLPGLFRWALQKWLAVFHVKPRTSLAGVSATFAKEAGRTGRFTPLYRGYAWRITIA